MKDLHLALSEEISAKTDLLNNGILKCFHAQNSYIQHDRAPAIHQHQYSTLHGHEQDGIPIILIPSHINKGYIMDLIPGYSLLKNLQSDGLSPYLLEWNQPSPNQFTYDESDYLEHILIPMLEYLNIKYNRKVYVLGHCMGGLLATAAAQIAPELVAGLITVSTPWNFHTSSFPYKATHSMYNHATQYLSNQQYVPKELINNIMQWPQINTTINKLLSLTTPTPLFSAVENWLDDGLNMTIPLFDSCIKKFCLLNQPYSGNWRVMNRIIDPSTIPSPSLSIITSKDKIVPPSSAMPLSVTLPNNTIHLVNTGHLGVIISKQYNIATKLRQWIFSLPN